MNKIELHDMPEAFFQYLNAAAIHLSCVKPRQNRKLE